MGGGDKTAMKDQDDGFGLAAFLLLSGILARLQAVGINGPNGPNDTRLLLDRAILTLEICRFRMRRSEKRGSLWKASWFFQVEEKVSNEEVHEASMILFRFH
jgi:hypothetical protein